MVKRFLILLDQTLNTLLGPLLNWYLWRRRDIPGPFGHPDETISSVLGKLQYLMLFLYARPLLCRLARWLDKIDPPNHCKRSIEWCVGWTVWQIEETWYKL